ncbi:MAG TPA: type II toxin-antitoxin system PemK/MazF family toxin [Flavisolibacter sp.]|nr:type II toxin-antitoxin system PemK/MazF family toxin [Flavisolibacter sp.]
MQKGDAVLIPFPFTDLSGTKLRPAVILAVTGLDIIVCFITSQLHHQEVTDVLLQPTILNGIKKVSLLKTGKIATLEKTLGSERLAK